MRTLFFALLLPLALLAQVEYQVYFEGVNRETEKVLRSISKSLSLQKIPPETKTALKQRATADIPNLLTGLHSLGLYGAEVDVSVETENVPAKVLFRVRPGVVYPLGDIEVELDGTPEENPIEGVTPRDIGLEVGAPALPEDILAAEEILLEILKERGYLFAMIDKEVIAKEATEEISLIFSVNPGPKILFGETSILGLRKVNSTYVASKIAWQTGDPFDPSLLTKTQTALENTGLFSTIAFEHAKEATEDGKLPFDLILQESYHRTIGVGAAYNTSLGPGFSFNWDHRNAFHRAHKLSAKADLFWIRQNGKVEYTIPEFFHPQQRLRFVAELEKERTEGFTETFYSAFAHLDRFPSNHLRYSMGAGYKQLFSSNSNNNEPFSLLKLPLSLRAVYTDDPLDPSSGSTLFLKASPTLRLNKSPFVYSIAEGIGTVYYPISFFTPQVLAFRLDVGTIFGPSTQTIPPPERFYAGSECTLRGYKYLTVSPLDAENKPIGGRSLFVFSLEHRLRITENFGWASFYEIGNVYDSPIPQLNKNQLQSWGVGFRYYTPVGPLRADIAFPVNPRPIDRSFQIYLSIGQAF